MESHFIEKVSLINFKCFDELNVNNLKRVNLISGKNNIGKTAFIEGIELLVSSKDAISLENNICKMIKRRQSNIVDKRDYEIDFIKNNRLPLKLKTDKKIVEIEVFKTDSSGNFGKISHISEADVLKLKVDLDEMNLSIDKMLEKLFNYSERYISILPVNFIKSVAMQEIDIAILYGKLVDLNKEEFLNKSLQLFDENIVSLKQRAIYNGQVVFKVLLKDREFPILLSSLGEGINRYIAILCAIWASKDGFLFIDEIENGIHYTNYDKLWKIIFEVSKMANCQVFATTHSKECIEAFNRYNCDNDGSYLEFYRNKKNKIVAKTRDKDLLEYSLSHNTRIRGE